MPGRAEAGRDLVFLSVEAALAKDGCPICRIGQDSAQRFLWNYLYERVNDPGSREELVASRGFCARHAWALGRFHDALGIAILYRHLLQEAAAELGRAEARRPRRLRGAPAAGRSAAVRECPACAHVRAMEDGALHALVAHLEPPEVWERITGSSALCLPHLRAAMARADARARRRLVQAGLTALAAVARDLDELIRKHDYRFSGEAITRDESVSWVRAIELMVGRDPLEDRRGAAS